MNVMKVCLYCSWTIPPTLFHPVKFPFNYLIKPNPFTRRNCQEADVLGGIFRVGNCSNMNCLGSLVQGNFREKLSGESVQALEGVFVPVDIIRGCVSTSGYH